MANQQSCELAREECRAAEIAAKRSGIDHDTVESLKTHLNLRLAALPGELFTSGRYANYAAAADDVEPSMAVDNLDRFYGEMGLSGAQIEALTNLAYKFALFSAMIESLNRNGS